MYDQGDPEKDDIKVLTVTVKSNFFNPQFTPREYERIILETWNIDDQLFDLNATDLDPLVSVFVHPTSPTSQPTTPLLALPLIQEGQLSSERMYTIPVNQLIGLSLPSKSVVR